MMAPTVQVQILAGLSLLALAALAFAALIVGLYLWSRSPGRQPCAPDAWVVNEIDARLTRHRQRREVDALLRELHDETPTEEAEEE